MSNGLLPPNATPQEIALDGATARISDVPVPVRDTYNAALYSAPLLPWLAWAFSVDEWNADWTDAQKRQAIADSVFVHRHKGTIGALRKALNALGYEVNVTEWFNKSPTPGPAYTFSGQVVIEQVGIPTLELFNQIVSVANAAKNVRSKIVGMDVLAKTEAVFYSGGVAFCGETVSIGAYTP